MKIAGVDEAGRGPLAGPVVAAAVVLSGEKPPWKLGDSKAMSAAKRDRLYRWLMDGGGDVAIGVVRQDEIDRINILQASLLAMKKAVLKLSPAPDMLLIDGLFTLDLPVEQKAVVKGDARIEAISAASIVAKVTRDRMMTGFHGKYPQYGFDRHKGYPTAEHRRAIELNGPSPIHRMSFKGVGRDC